MTLDCPLDKNEKFPAHSGINAHEFIGGCLKMRSDENVNGEVAKHMRRLRLGSASGLMLHQISWEAVVHRGRDPVSCIK
jgi:hypothetical protein